MLPLDDPLKGRPYLFYPKDLMARMISFGVTLTVISQDIEGEEGRKLAN